MKLTHQLKEEKRESARKKKRHAHPQNENGRRMEEKKFRVSYTIISSYS